MRTIMLSGCTVTRGRNDGATGGGGICDNGGVVSIAGSEIREIVAQTNGGGVFNDRDVTLSGTPVASNEPNTCRRESVAGCVESS